MKVGLGFGVGWRWRNDKITLDVENPPPETSSSALWSTNSAPRSCQRGLRLEALKSERSVRQPDYRQFLVILVIAIFLLGPGRSRTARRSGLVRVCDMADESEGRLREKWVRTSTTSTGKSSIPVRVRPAPDYPRGALLEDPDDRPDVVIVVVLLCPRLCSRAARVRCKAQAADGGGSVEWHDRQGSLRQLEERPQTSCNPQAASQGRIRRDLQIGHPQDTPMSDVTGAIVLVVKTSGCWALRWRGSSSPGGERVVPG
jgi:hypothetical protein